MGTHDVAPTEVLVGTTCRPAGASRGRPGAGQPMWDAVQVAASAARLPPGVRLRGIARLNGNSGAAGSPTA